MQVPLLNSIDQKLTVRGDLLGRGRGERTAGGSKSTTTDSGSRSWWRTSAGVRRTRSVWLSLKKTRNISNLNIMTQYWCLVDMKST